MRSCHKSQRRICSEKVENISIVKNRKRGDTKIYEGSVKKEIYSNIEITTNITSILYAEEEWEKENSVRLLIFEQLGDQEQLSIATDSNLIDKIEKKKVLIKMDLKQEYNNIRISVRNAKIRLYLIFIFCSFQSVLFLELEVGISGMSQVTVLLSHNHML